MHPRSLALFGVLMGFALAACNAPSPSSKANKTPPTADGDLAKAKAKALVAGASGNRMQVVSIFDGPDGLVGLIIEPTNGGPKQVAWGSPSLEVVMPGDALDSTGASHSAKALAEQKVHLSTPELAANVMGQGIVVGKKGPMITAFMDPNCIHCNTFYNALMPQVKKGKVRVRFMMVGILRPSSMSRAAAIVSAKDPAAALAADERNFEKRANQPADENPDAQGMQIVQANTALFQRAGGTGTPAVLSCHTASPEPQFSAGAPPDIEAFVASLDPSSPTCK